MTDFVTFESLKQQSPTQILSFLEQADTSQHDFNWWLGLAQIAIHEIFRVPGQVNLEWAEVALHVREILATKDQTSGASRDLMMLKARLISTLGNTEPIPLASVNEIVDWFFDSLVFTFAEAKIAVVDWQQHPAEEILKLRYIKNNLAVIDLLKTHEQIKNHTELQQWLDFRTQLP